MTSNLDTSCSHVGLKVNSVELYDVLNTLEKVMLQNYSFIKDSIQFVSETKLDNSCELTNAFYDFSLHVFKLRSDDIGSFSLQNKLDLDWHANRPEPVYDENYSLFFQLIHYWLYKFHGIQL